MVTSNANIDYVHTSFQYPLLTKVHDTPTYETLKRIKDEMKANASNVQCDLGGGKHGHLGLVLTPTEYATISDTPYERPGHPGVDPIAGNTQWENQVNRDRHQEQIRLYREANGVEAALIGQLTVALPPLYLESYRDSSSNTITTPLVDILKDLFTIYGAISEEELDAREQALRARIFDLTQPLLHLFAAVEDLQQLATASDNPYTTKQMINLGLHLIRNMSEFETDIGKWYDSPPEDHTWKDFKNHFTKAYNRLRRLRGPTMRNTAYHQQAQYITQQVLNVVQTNREQIFQEVKATEDNILRALKINHFNDLQPDLKAPTTAVVQPIEPVINATTSDSLQAQMLKLLERIEKKLDDGTTKRPPKRKYTRKDTSKYCWSHGACTHGSSDCRSPKPGHKNEATFENKMGGSTSYCTLAT